jgi:hypothetical protein
MEGESVEKDKLFEQTPHVSIRAAFVYPLPIPIL